MLKMDRRLLVDSFVYEEFLGKGKKGESLFGKPVVISLCRIDKNIQVSSSKNDNNKTYDSIVFCYSDWTTPFIEFKERSKITYDGSIKIIQKVVPVVEPYSNKLFSYELEVI